MRLKKKDLKDYFGLELELMGFYSETNKRVEYPLLRKLLHEFKNKSDWKEHEEGGNLTELNRSGEKISLEPGGQFEYSTPPLGSVHDVSLHLEKFRDFLKEYSKSEGVYWLSVGYDPFSRLEKIPHMPKKRYQVMRDVLEPLGSKTLHMMHATCGTQVSIDYHNEEDMHKKLVVSQTLSPVLTLLFANSIIEEGKVNPLSSIRQETWNHFDSVRTGIIEESFRDKFTYKDYINHLLDIPMLVISRDQNLVDCHSKTLSNFMKEGLGDHKFVIDDWIGHLRSVFYFARLKNVIEIRTVDSTSIPLIKSFVSLICGLLYDPAALDKAFEYSMNIGSKRVKEFCAKISLEGFSTTAGGIKISEVIENFIGMYSGCHGCSSDSISGENPIEPLMNMTEAKKNLSSLIKEKYKSSNPDDILAIYKELNLVFA